MKTMMACVVAVLVGSCFPCTNEANSKHRHNEVCKMLVDYATSDRGRGIGCRLRGPLSISQAEDEQLAESRKLLEILRQRPGGEALQGEEPKLSKEWVELKSKY